MKRLPRSTKILAAIALLTATGCPFRSEASPSNPDHGDPAVQAVSQGTNSQTEADLEKQRKAFNLRQFADAFDQFGQHDQKWNSDAKVFIRSWVNCDFG